MDTLILSTRGNIAGNPITSSVELALFLQRECGAEGFRLEGTQLLALRWDASGSEQIVDRFECQTSP